MNTERLLAHYERIADAPDAIGRLRRFILDLAVRGKLVPQDPNEGTADELIQSLKKARRIWEAKGRIRREKGDSAAILDEEKYQEIPRSWAWARLVELGQTQTGTSPSSANPDLFGDFIPFIKPGDLDGNEINYGGAGLSKVGVEHSRLASPQSVLMVCIGATLGKVNKTTRPICFNQQINSLTPFLEGLSDYVAIALKASSFQALAWGKAGTGTLPIINKGKWEILPIPLPPLIEQHRIVAKVDELMVLCDRLETARGEREKTRDRLTAASLARLNAVDTATFRDDARFVLDALPAITTRLDQIKHLRQTILNLAVRGKLVPQDLRDEPASQLLKRIAAERADLVKRRLIRREEPLDAITTAEMPFSIPNRWLWSRIGDAVLFTQYGTSEKSYPSENGVPVLTMGNIQGGLAVWNNEKKIPETSEELPALFLKKFDILYNRTNSAELVGKTGIYLGEDGVRTFASYLIRLRPSLKWTEPRYLNLAMNAPDFRETQIVPLIKKQTGQANVNGTALKNMLIPLPPLAEQHRIVAKVDELMTLCDRLEAVLTTAAATRRSLLDALLAEALFPVEDGVRIAAE